MRWGPSAQALLVLLALFTFNGCERTRAGIQPEEMRIVARWLEDQAHGIPRRPGELQLSNASAEMLHFAQWAGGDDHDGVRTPPAQIRGRMNRHRAVAAALRSGVVFSDPTHGLVAPNPRLSAADQALASDITDPENRDRRTLDAIVISVTGASKEAAAWYREAVLTARLAHDTADGGRLYESLDP